MPLKDVLEEANRILDQAQKQRVTLRLFGGIAIHDRCPSASNDPLLRRQYADIDLMGRRDQSKPIKDIFAILGYEPRARFNALYGKERLVFNDLENMRRVDIFLDEFRMCHLFLLTDRLDVSTRTLPLSDLLATKLQVVEATEREYKDVICLLLDHEIGDTDEGERINGKYVARLASNDWGVYATFKKSLERVGNYLKKFQLDETKKTIVASRIDELKRRLDEQPKSLKWKLRARVGESQVWYDLPEQDRKVVTD